MLTAKRQKPRDVSPLHVPRKHKAVMREAPWHAQPQQRYRLQTAHNTLPREDVEGLPEAPWHAAAKRRQNLHATSQLSASEGGGGAAEGSLLCSRTVTATTSEEASICL